MKREKSLFRRWLDGQVDWSAMLEQPECPEKESTAPYTPHRDEASAQRAVRRGQTTYTVLAIVSCLAFCVFMLLTVANLPGYGSDSAPTVNEVAQRYVEDGTEETGAVNTVAGMILDYRAFDTLGESHVLFTAITCVFIMLRIDKKETWDDELPHQMETEHLIDLTQDSILKYTAFVLVPAIILFGIYIILNGHLSPGGGFSGGAIIGAGLILFNLAFGPEKAGKFFTPRLFKTISMCALGFYSVAKCYSFFTGANHLESHIPLGTPGNILSSGLILPLNIAVGLVVACTMYGFYCMFKKGNF